jgi:hypothetical protein
VLRLTLLSCSVTLGITACNPLQGPPLALRETWQVEVVGSKFVRAGLVGAVKWAAQEAKAIAGSTPFRLQVV